MRWLPLLLGALVFAGGFYVALAPRVFRPVLRVALELEPGNPDDDARAAGLALAIEDREERAGRWRLAAAHQIRQPNGALSFPKPRAHTMLHGLDAAHSLQGPEGPLLSPRPLERTAAIQAWMKGRGLERLVELRSDYMGSFGMIDDEARGVPSGRGPGEVLQSRPDAVVLGGVGSHAKNFKALKEAGFQGPVFFGTRWISMSYLLTFDGAFIVLAPALPAPPEFRTRHPHPFAWAAYRGALVYFDALDADRQADPLDLARNLWGGSVFDLYRDAPRVYEVRNGRLEPSK